MKKREHGQTVVLVAFLIIALLLMAGLAIDGGTAYLNRRRMQNAADAGALAGANRLAEAICDDDDPQTTDAAVHAAIAEYAERNGVDDGYNNVVATYVKFEGAFVVSYDPPVYVGNGAVPEGAAGVIVTTTITRPTYFLGLIGQSEGGASAEATAVTGPPLLMGGLRPFGVPLETIQQLNEGDCFTQSFKNCKPENPEDCPIRDEGGDLIGQHRNWLNLNHVWNQSEEPDWPRATGAPGSAAWLKEWMENGWNGTLWADCFWDDGCRWGDFIHAKPGSNSSGIGALPLNLLFFIPIYDIVPEYDQIPAPKAPPHPQGGNYYYHVVGFAGVSCPDKSQGGGWVECCVQEVIMGQGQPSPNVGYGSDVCATHTMIVTLWR